MVALENNTMDLAAVKNISLIAWALMFIGLLIKLPSFGPHVWIPWVHGSHPTPSGSLDIRPCWPNGLCAGQAILNLSILH